MTRTGEANRKRPNSRKGCTLLATHVVTVTHLGIQAMYALPLRRQQYILQVAHAYKRLPIHKVCNEVRKLRGIPFSADVLAADMVELQLSGLIKVHQ